jgi:Zn-dependent protease with chaperone function
LIVAGAAATLTLVVASVLAAAAWRTGRRHLDGFGARARAEILACWRLAPATLAAATATLALVAFLRFEPPHVDEAVGVVLPLLALAGLVTATAGAARLALAWHRTRSSLRTWHPRPAGVARSLPILAVESPFPIVAVVGVWRPRLYVARQVVEKCDSGELDAIVAHEAAHVASRDNLTRLLFAGTPIVPFVSHYNRELESAWVAAAEDAADDAARRETRCATALASALAKVARMASGSAPLLHASAILSGSGVEHRVRRLLEGSAEAPEHRSRVARGVFLAAAMLIVLSPHALRSVYDVAEYCVRHLP